MPTIQWKRMKQFVMEHSSFIITSHVRPDCDALGSELALAGILETLGKRATIVNADPVPGRLAFIDPDHRIQVLGQDIAVPSLDSFDAFLVVDTSVWPQLGAMADILRGTDHPIGVIDHHASGSEIGAAVMCKDEHAEATGRLIVELARYLGVKLSAEMAQALFTAVATDTGWFRFPSTSSSTFRVAAELVDAGAVPHEVYRHLYEQDSLGRAKLRSILLDHLTVEQNGQLAFSYLVSEDFEKTSAHRSETEDFVNMALAISGTKVAILLTEQANGEFRVSFRSRDNTIDCSKVAARFNGGGHRAAAGATVAGPLNKALDAVLGEVRSALA